MLKSIPYVVVAVVLIAFVGVPVAKFVFGVVSTATHFLAMY